MTGDLIDRVMVEVGRQLADLFSASGITDAEPLSTTVDDEHRVFVRSRSRGRVQIGRLNDLRLLAISSTYADELERALQELTTKARAAWRETADQKRQRARELKAQGLSAGQIATRMTVERNAPSRPPISARQVRRWLSERKR